MTNNALYFITKGASAMNFKDGYVFIRVCESVTKFVPSYENE